MRQQRSLAGLWQFQLDSEGTVTIDKFNPERQIPVPLPWQAAFADLTHYSGFGWYRHEFELDETWLTGELLLNFGAVDYWCEVFLNGQYIGQHEGGYTFFSFPVRDYVKVGPNELTVRVYDVAQTQIVNERWPVYSEVSSHRQPPFSPNEIPHGKQEWYVNVGGIWQDVTLTAVSSIYVKHVRVTPQISDGVAHLDIELGGKPATSQTEGQLVVNIVDKENQVVAEQKLTLGLNQDSHHLQVLVPSIQLWEPKSPYLYTAKVVLDTNGQPQDVWTERFGFREINSHNGLLHLNGQPFFLLAVLDQDIYQDTIYTVPSREFLRDQFRKAQELGFNCLRCHIKPPDPVYLDLADEMGLLVWAEIPSWRTFYPKGTLHPHQLDIDEGIKNRVVQTLHEMVRRDFNHPSLIIWTLVNEDWGTSLPLSQADRTWVADLYRLVKELDATRLAVDNSACPHPWGPNVHVHSDIDDFHIYANIPDAAYTFEQEMDQFSLRPLWTYSTYGDTERSGQEPLILSEFGNWGLPSLKSLRDPDGSDPAWFELGPWWSGWEGEPGWPGGVETRFQQFGLNAIWPDYEAFATATQWHQYAALKFEIEAMRRQPQLAGYVVTELSDIYWESNGLLDFKRQPKAYHDCFSMFNRADVLVARPNRYSAWSNEAVDVELYASHYGATNWGADNILEWQLPEPKKQLHKVQVGALPTAQVSSLGYFKLTVPATAQLQTTKFVAKLSDPAGKELTCNELEILTLPDFNRQPLYQGQVTVVTPMPLQTAVQSGSADTQAQTAVLGSFASELRNLGYAVSTVLTTQTGLAVTTYPNAQLLKWVREGGDLLYISSGPGPFYWVQVRGGAYSGNWMSNFSWLRPGVHRRLQVANPLGMAFREVMPKHTILGLPITQPEAQPDFLAGMVGGWVNHPSVHTVQFRYGKGRVVMTTFALEKALLEKKDPVAVAMLHDLVEYLGSVECNPTLKANY